MKKEPLDDEDVEIAHHLADTIGEATDEALRKLFEMHDPNKTPLRSISS